MSMSIRATSHAVRAAAPTSTHTSATAAEMKAAKKSATALDKFFATTMKRYDANLAKPRTTMLKAIKSTFGSKKRDIPPEFLIARQTLAPQFFYISTAIDTRTGALGQSINATGPYYGPLLPPPGARIKGRFSRAQGDTLLNIVARGLRSNGA